MSSDPPSSTGNAAQPKQSRGFERRFGRHLRSLRRARGLTQEVLAERSNLSADTIRRLEHGSFSPSLATLRGLCLGLDLAMSTLFASFELGERDVSRELVDAVSAMTGEERERLLQILQLLVSILGRGPREE